MAPGIELREVTHRYGTATVVDRVSLSVEHGELLVLVGGSGSGKTTTLKTINRLVEPMSGAVLLEGQDVRALPAPDLRRRIGYCFQQLGLFVHMTVAENIGITPRLLGWEPARIAARVNTLLEVVALDPPTFRGRMPHELSGGQQQRVAVARALGAEPRVLLMDEPFGALDPLTRDALQVELVRIRRALGFTCVFVTHDMTEALLLGDRIAVMSAGRLVQVGTPAELIAAPSDEVVARLLETPRRHARRVQALLGAGHA